MRDKLELGFFVWGIRKRERLGLLEGKGTGQGGERGGEKKKVVGPMM